jgi:hypothetical protein
MDLLDVNVLLNAFNSDVPNHERYRGWLEDLMFSGEPYGVSELVLSSVLRIATHPRLRIDSTNVHEFIWLVRNQPSAVILSPGPLHFEMFMDMCLQGRLTGNLVPDAYLAALAMESGCELVTDDRGFARFPRLQWRRPF